MPQCPPYKITLMATGGLLLPLIAHIILTATGSQLNPVGHLLPLTVGALAGFTVGLLLDRNLKLVKELRATNSSLQEEVKKKTLSETRYQSLFENNHSVILLIKQESGEIIDANSKASEFYGYSKEQLTNMPITDINLLSMEQIKLEIARAAKEKRSQLYFQHRLQCGDVRDVEVYTGPLLVDDTPCLISVIHDITELKQLRGIIPICCKCKQIRDDQGYWNQLEQYISEHSDALFSHGICPNCIEREYYDI